jgi:hypothetical protein
MSKLQLSRKFVQEAYYAANSEWKVRITKEFPKLFQSFTLAKLKEMVFECYKLNRKDYIDFFYSVDIEVVPADGPNFYVAVRLPEANINWTFSAFAFIRHFVEYMKDKETHNYPIHHNKDVKAVSEKLGWESSGCLLIYVQPSISTVDDKELFETSEEFVKEAHKEACHDWKKKIEEQFPELFEAEKTFPIGTIVIIGISLVDEEYILAGIQNKGYLISIIDGKPWDDENCMNIVDAKVTYSQLEKYVDNAPFQIL